jgi:hypothetical protein
MGVMNQPSTDEDEDEDGWWRDSRRRRGEVWEKKATYPAAAARTSFRPSVPRRGARVDALQPSAGRLIDC